MWKGAFDWWTLTHSSRFGQTMTLIRLSEIKNVKKVCTNAKCSARQVLWKSLVSYLVNDISSYVVKLYPLFERQPQVRLCKWSSTNCFGRSRSKVRSHRTHSETRACSKRSETYSGQAETYTNVDDKHDMWTHRHSLNIPKRIKRAEKSLFFLIDKDYNYTVKADRWYAVSETKV